MRKTTAQKIIEYFSAFSNDAVTRLPKASYIRTRTQDDEFYTKLLIDYLEQFAQADRAEINNLLIDKLSDGLNQEQKEVKIGNLLTKLRPNKLILNTGTRSQPLWRLAEWLQKGLWRLLFKSLPGLYINMLSQRQTQKNRYSRFARSSGLWFSVCALSYARLMTVG